MKEKWHFPHGASLKFTHADGSVFRLDVGDGVLEISPAEVPALVTALTATITPAHVVTVVAKYFDVLESRIRGKSRRAEAVLPRAVAAFVARKQGASLPAIGRAIDKHHASALYACRWVQERLDNGNVRLRHDIEEIERRINEQWFDTGGRLDDPSEPARASETSSV